VNTIYLVYKYERSSEYIWTKLGVCVLNGTER